MDEIMFSNMIKHSAKAAIAGLGFLAAAQVHSAPLQFDLSGLGMDVPSNYVGRDGLYVGTSFDYYNYPGNNWTFQDVKLSIDQITGAASMTGSMNRNRDNSSWTINTTLNDLVIRTGVGAGTTRQDFNAGSDNLSTLLSSTTNGTGVEWKSLDMTLSNGSSSWDFGGFAMPALGHLNVADLFFRSNFGGATGLIFDAWYKSDEMVTKYRWVEQTVTKWKWKWDKKKRKYVKKYYDVTEYVKEKYQVAKYVGDTKAYATPSEVPLPAAIWLFAPALAGFTALRRKRNA
jgi:hypothetical protein